MKDGWQWYRVESAHGQCAVYAPGPEAALAHMEQELVDRGVPYRIAASGATVEDFARELCGAYLDADEGPVTFAGRPCLPRHEQMLRSPEEGGILLGSAGAEKSTPPMRQFSVSSGA